MPGRECGGCTACCQYLIINAPELKKPPGVLCPHATEKKGCGIYETRPHVCRGWFCAWRALPWLDLGDEWRPDRCGLLVTVTDKNIPPDFSRQGLQFQILGAPADPFWHHVLSWQPLVAVLMRCVEARFPVFLAVPAPPGHYGKSFFLNPRLAAARDRSQAMQILTEAYRLGAMAPKNKATL